MINGDATRDDQVVRRLQSLLSGKPRPEDKVVVMRSDADVEYQRWIEVTGWVEQSGGLLTIQREEELTVQVP